MTDSRIHAFVCRQKELLDKELKSETEESLSPKSNEKEEGSVSRVLQNLETSEVSVGLYGRTVVCLSCNGDEHKLLPAHKFTVGDEVEIHSKAKDRRRPGGGVISQVTDISISVALFGAKNGSADQDEEDFLGVPPLSLIPKSSVQVHNKLVQALDSLEKYGVNHQLAGSVVRACFEPAQSPPVAPLPAIDPLNTQLDTSQLEAIQFALSGSPLALIHGPPGTGKTTAISEFIFQATARFQQRVLVTAPSNVAVDNVLERLVQMQAQQNNSATKRRKRKDLASMTKLNMVRIGHPARIKPSILAYSMESLVQSSDGTEIVRDVRRELQQFLRITQSPKAKYSDKRIAYREIKSLRKEVRAREEKVVQQLIGNAQVVLCTTVGAANEMLKSQDFDIVVIDEAAQALEASCWIPALKGRRLVLAGDHKQLPPTIKNHAIKNELGMTLFERIMDMYSENTKVVSRMLSVQYRMHQDIANWASQAMYHGELQSFEGVKDRRLSQIAHVEGDQPTLLLMDTTGCGMEEGTNAAGSRYNEGEAELVQQHVTTLVEMGLKQQEIAIISPYNGQVELLKNLLLPNYPKLEIRSVDGFQGGEREAVVLSLVRSSDQGGIGFLKDDRRLNVAITRAKRHVALICDCETVSKSNFIHGLVEWMHQHGEVRSAMEFQVEESDFHHAQMELQKIMQTQAAEAAKEMQTIQLKDKGAVESTRKSTNQRSANDEAMDGERRKALLDKISAFAESGKHGEEMKLSSELSRFDRRVVHEFATTLGLGHCSEGVDGVDRRIKLTIQNEPLVPPSEPLTLEETGPSSGSNTNESTSREQPAVSFSALCNEDSSDSEEELEKELEIPVPAQAPPTKNQMLADLAREREQRAKDRAKQETEEKAVQKVAPTGSKKPKKNKKGKKAGGSASRKKTKEEDVLDDMAFLDKQIENVQNSHGRKVQGKGSYKTIVNGILLSKPAPRETKKDPKAVSALNSKLKQAQEGRLRKNVGKKKK